jgi:hypothetical protein
MLSVSDVKFISLLIIKISEIVEQEASKSIFSKKIKTRKCFWEKKIEQKQIK